VKQHLIIAGAIIIGLAWGYWGPAIETWWKHKETKAVPNQKQPDYDQQLAAAQRLAEPDPEFEEWFTWQLHKGPEEAGQVDAVTKYRFKRAWLAGQQSVLHKF
jgi:hypothetical protein